MRTDPKGIRIIRLTRRDRTGSAGKQEKWKKGNNGEGVINFAQSTPPAKLSFKI